MSLTEAANSKRIATDTIRSLPPSMPTYLVSLLAPVTYDTEAANSKRTYVLALLQYCYSTGTVYCYSTKLGVKHCYGTGTVTVLVL